MKARKASTTDRPIAVLASGPSLLLSDVCKVQEVMPVVAVNTTWFLVNTEIIVAGDYRWWKVHGDKVTARIKISRSEKAERAYGAKRMRSKVPNGYNSGMSAVEWCIQKAYGPVVMLGFDCSLRDGTHHHGDHTETPNPTDERVKRWRQQFCDLRRAYPHANVVNCSRYTELDVFPVKSLDEVLCGLS